MRIIKVFGLIGLTSICLLSNGCSKKTGWLRNDSATLGHGENARSAVRLSNDATPSESEPVTGTIFLVKTEVSDELIVNSIEFKLFGNQYVENSTTGGLTLENGSGRQYSSDKITGRFLVYTDSKTNETQGYFTLRFSLDYTDENGDAQNSYSLDEDEDFQLKVSLKEDLTFKFTYGGSDNANQEFDYSIIASNIKKA